MTSTPIIPARGDDFTLGELLDGRYRLDSMIGRGGMATVYEATDESLGRTVAIKVFPPGVAADDDDRRRGEVRLLARLSHYALVTLFDAVEDGASGRAYLVMEHIDGPDLRQRLLFGPLTPQEAAKVGADVAAALAYIHSNGIVHRDVKPGNILLPKPGAHSTHTAQLADFGIARIVDSTRVTSSDAVLGTAGYLSPEQAVGTTVDAATDIFSLGLVLIECLTGERAFPGSAVEATAARLSRDPVVPDVFGPTWRNLLVGMTARDPGARPVAQDVARQLAILAVDDVASATVPLPSATGQDAPTRVLPAAAPTERLSRVHTPDRPTPRARRRSRLPGVVVGVVAAGVVVAVTAALWAASGNVAPGRVDPSPSPTARTIATVAHGSVEYPSVDGNLGRHLDDLEQAVESTNTSDYSTTTARPLQLGVLSVAQAAADGDFEEALANANTLADRVQGAADAGTITQRRHDEIVGALDRVRDDLKNAIDHPGKHDKPGKDN